MNFLYQENPLYLSGFEHKLGSVRRSLDELKAERLMVGPTETLAEMGYCYNRGLGPDETLLSLTTAPVRTVLQRVPQPSSVIFQHCQGETAVLAREAEDQIGASRNRYFPGVVLQEVQLDNVPYFCSFASGCAGFLSLLITSAGVLQPAQAEPAVCVMADTLPIGEHYYFDMVRERILGSDHASAFVVGRESGDYQVLGVSFYSTTRTHVPLVEIVKRTVQMTQELAKGLQLDLAAHEVVLHYPNIFPETWKMVTRYLKLPKAEAIIDEMAERAHCGATDSVITLSKMHRGQEGRLHIVANYGVGLHLGVCILRETGGAES
jgi:3-oxoacyl-[acyl-carrier-protein] synthase III